jgi:glucose/arabinose dehydrogenase
MRPLPRAGLAAALLLAPLPLAAAEVPQGPPNVPEFPPAFREQTRAPEALSGITLAAEPVAEGLANPWGIAILPDGAGYLVTERAGRLRHVAPDGTISEPIAGVPEVLAEEQGGLLDVAVSRTFAQDRTIFLTYAKPVGDRSATAAARATLGEDMASLTDVTDIFVQDPPSPSPMHYGSRITPVDEQFVFITTGEHFTEEERVYAQALDKTYGKVIRVRIDGSVPDDNPFVQDQNARPEIWSLGHRNLQGDALAPDGSYWTIEHGPQGGDELNRPIAGGNYGWPEISYGENYDDTPVGRGVSAMEGLEQPVYYWDPVIAPGDMVFYQGSLFPDWQGDLLIGSLNPGGLVRLELDGEVVIGEERMLPDLGRVRDVEVDSDGSLLVITDFEDGGLYRLKPAG